MMRTCFASPAGRLRRGRKKILDAFISAKFEGGRHERRVEKMDARLAPPALRLRNVDPAVAEAIEHEQRRQQENIELIASENFVSGRAGGARLRAHQQIRRGYPKKRWYAAANTLTPSNSLPLIARKNFLARNTPTFSRIPAARRTWPFISPCSSPRQAAHDGFEPRGHLTHATRRISPANFLKSSTTACARTTSGLITISSPSWRANTSQK